MFCFFKQKTAYEMRIIDWSSDVCSSDLDRLDQVLEAIAGTGYGLTLGVHSRIDSTVEQVYRRLPVGNTYVNRNMIGAVVGVQPFGGQGLSGTGPKAGGPRYQIGRAHV